jgi:hypothetical protein
MFDPNLALLHALSTLECSIVGFPVVGWLIILVEVGRVGKAP